MQWNYITFRSVTYAQRGKKVLEQAHIPCAMIRSPRCMEQRGCGYALKLQPGRGEEAVEALNVGEIQWLKRYLWDEKGRPEQL